MTEISATLVKELRDETNVGMMECKKALQEAGGDKAKAVKILRERGMAIAEKKSSRAANQGMIASAILEDGRIGSLIEINCETDFAAKNETFRNFVKAMAAKAAASDGALADTAKAEITAKIAEIGENIIARRNVRYTLSGNGLIAAYIHHGASIGVLLEIGCEKLATVQHAAFQDAAKDICLHITAHSPAAVDPAGVSADVVAAEREIYAKQVQGKPANIIGKIVEGKLGKFFEQVCLIEQAFVKDQEIKVKDYLKAKGAEAGDTFTVRRFVRFQVGEKI